MKKNLRADIQGLRGIAVLFVVLFHLNIPLITAGFVGVDVFFVISGYLITNQITKETKNAKFRLRNFYFRRIKRLAPGFLSVSLFTIIICVCVMPPEHLINASKGLISSLFFVSNFYFISSSEYFDISSEFRPFIHTWSLSVEEQFYLFWPIMCLFFLQKLKIKLKKMAFITFVIIFLSICTAVLLEQSRASFYFTPARIYELLLGALLSIVGTPIAERIKSNFLSILGIILIAFSVFYITPHTPFPSYLALLPCIGACFLILCERTASNKILLENKILYFFGNISYSLYLIHWPVITLFNFIYAGPKSFLINTLLFLLSTVLAFINFKFVEEKFRYKEIIDFRSAFKLLITISVLLILFSIVLIQQSGWSWRYSNQQIEVLEKVSESRVKSQTHFENYKKNVFIGSNGNENVLIIGDSYSEDAFNALSLQTVINKNYNLFHFSIDEKCFVPATYKKKFAEKLLMIDHSIINSDCNSQLDLIKQEWESVDIGMVVIGNAIRYKAEADIEHKRIPSILKFYAEVFPSSRLLFLGLNQLSLDPRLGYLMFDNETHLNDFFFSSGYEKLKEENQLLKKVVENLNVEYIDILSLTCDNKIKSCNVFKGNNGILLYDNDNHWSFEGEKFFGNLLGKKIFPHLYLK